MKISHYLYTSQVTEWEKYRYIKEGGREFVDKYLERWSLRESQAEFDVRKKLTPCPAFAKAAVNEVKNIIYERLCEVIRSGGCDSYRRNRVDANGNTMESFIGRCVLDELLFMGKVGVCVDKRPLPENASLADTRGITPYLYTYKAEDILSWKYDSDNVLVDVCVKHCEEREEDQLGGLNVELEEYTRHFYMEDGFCVIETFDDDDKLDSIVKTKLTRIPFHILEISESLLTDIADYQIALLNIASSDLNICKFNFPFYVEQYNPMSEFANTGTKVTVDENGNEVKTQQAAPVGPSAGRRYPIGAEAPQFINPSPEPLKASMEKQEQLKQEIRLLLSLTISNLKNNRSSAESKQQDLSGTESGLNYIGLELEHAERQIAEIWHMYEGQTDDTAIIYPDTYSQRTNEDRQREADELSKQIVKCPSITMQKALAIRIARLLVGHIVDADVLEKIEKEIQEAKIIAIDPETLRSDLEACLVDAETASAARNYPTGCVEKAKKDHAERAARIVQAQIAAKGTAEAGTQAAIDEKKTSQSADMSPSGEKAVRS